MVHECPLRAIHADTGKPRRGKSLRRRMTAKTPMRSSLTKKSEPLIKFTALVNKAFRGGLT
ncbi:hypothetical protein C1J02_12370 [Sulfitobacter sp. SK011]|nr:hypothetical protein C1J02_12370 [Sulfitobacter sp. SK011]